MAIVFPGGLDNFTNPSPADNLSTPAVLHTDQHSDLNDAVEALEAKVGSNGSLVTGSFDFRISQLESTSTVPGGSDSQLQFNNAGSFDGARLDYSYSAGEVTLSTELDGDDGESLVLQGANALADGSGGGISILGGEAPGLGTGGGIEISGGNSEDGVGGSLSFQSGASVTGQGGDINFIPGEGVTPGKMFFTNPGNFTALELDLSQLSGNQVMVVPDKSGTIAFLDDVVGATWGSIVGTLSDQTDLQAELGAKGDVFDSGVVVEQLTKGVTDSKHITAAAIIPPATNILTITNAAASTLALNITAAKTLTLTAVDNYALTVPATGVAALLGVANTFTGINIFTVFSGLQAYTNGVTTNVLIGLAVGNTTMTGVRNILIGNLAGEDITDGEQNVCLGVTAGRNITTGDNNLLIGFSAGREILGGLNNVCIGASSGLLITSGGSNMMIGRESGAKITTANENVFIGQQAGTNATSSSNVMIGNESGRFVTSGASNVFLGYKAGYRQTTLSNLFIIDNQERASAAVEITNAILYGVMASAPASQTLRINAALTVAGSMQFNSVVNGTGLAQGVYVPTGTAAANLDATPTLSEAQYLRVGNAVTVSGRFAADPTLAATTTSFEITLPIASNIGAVEDAAGVAFCGNIAGMGAEIIGSVANNTAVIQWKSSDITSQTWSYIFTYQVI